MTPSPIIGAVLIVAAGIVTAGLTTAGFVTRARAQNQNYSWCLLSSAHEGGENCGFTSYDQCMATRIGIGGFCQINTQYQVSISPTSAPHRSHKAHLGKRS